MLVLPEIDDSNPAKQVAQDYIAAYEKLHGHAPATFGANVYDAGLLLQNAIPEAARKAQPGTRNSALPCAMRWSRRMSWWGRRACTT